MGYKKKGNPLIMGNRRWRRTSVDPARPELGARDVSHGRFDPATMDYVAMYEEWRKLRVWPAGLKKHLIKKAGQPNPIGLIFYRDPISGLGATKCWYFTIDKGRLMGKVQRWRFPRLADIPPDKVTNPEFWPLGSLKITEQNIDVFERGIGKLKTIWKNKSWDKFSNVIVDTTHHTEAGLMHTRRIDFVIDQTLPGNYIFRVTNRFLKKESLLSGNPEYSHGPTVSWHFSRCEEFIPRFEAFLAKFRELQVPMKAERDALKNPEFKMLLGTPEQEEAFYAARNKIADKINRIEDEANIPER